MVPNKCTRIVRLALNIKGRECFLKGSDKWTFILVKALLEDAFYLS